MWLCCCCAHEGGRLTSREEELVKSGAIMTRLLSKELRRNTLELLRCRGCLAIAVRIGNFLMALCISIDSVVSGYYTCRST